MRRHFGKMGDPPCLVPCPEGYCSLESVRKKHLELKQPRTDCMCVPLTLQNSHQPLLFFSSAMVTARCQVAVYLKRHGSGHITPLNLRCTVWACVSFLVGICAPYVWCSLIILYFKCVCHVVSCCTSCMLGLSMNWSGVCYSLDDTTLKMLHFMTASCSIKRHICKGRHIHNPGFYRVIIRSEFSVCKCLPCWSVLEQGTEFYVLSSW